MTDDKIVSLNVKKPEPETPPVFKRGDVVQLNSGGTPMTVEGSTRNKVIAVWHNESGDLCTGTFHPEMLTESDVPVEPAPSK